MDDTFEQIIERMRAAHLRWPSLRFNQIIGNVVYSDNYWIKDDAFLKDLTEHMEDNCVTWM